MALRIDTTVFFKALKGKESKAQIEGYETLIEAFAHKGDGDVRKLAYILATARWETAGKMQPIDEYGKGKGRPYGKPTKTGQTYYGRGFVQLTWERNYALASKKLGVDFVNDPDLVKVLSHSAEIAVVGMMEGWFTGKKLGDYFTKKASDPWNARRIINGTDKAAEIARLYQEIHQALLLALPSTAAVAALVDIPPEPPPEPLHKSRINQATAGLAVVGAGAPAVSAVANIANTAAEQVQVVAENVNGAVETTTQTVTVLKENHDTFTGIIGWLLSPYVMLGFAAIAIILVAVIFFYRWKIKDKYGV